MLNCANYQKYANYCMKIRLFNDYSSLQTMINSFHQVHRRRHQSQFACYRGLGSRYHYYMNKRAGGHPHLAFLHGSSEAHPHLVNLSTERGASATSDGKVTRFNVFDGMATNFSVKIGEISLFT